MCFKEGEENKEKEWKTKIKNEISDLEMTRSKYINFLKKIGPII